MKAAKNPAARRNNNHAGASKQAMTSGGQSGGGATRGGIRKAGGGLARGVKAGGGVSGGAAGRAAKLLRAGATVLVFASCLALAACGDKGSQRQKSNAPPKSDFERGLDTVRRGSYVRIYVIRRADGQPLSSEDRLYLRQNTPMETGMWVVTEDNRAAIAGAGFEFEPKHFEALSQRFTVEDYTSK